MVVDPYVDHCDYSLLASEAAHAPFGVARRSA